MKDLHIKLNDREQFQLQELAGYCQTSESNIIRTLINMGFNAAKTQVYLDHEPKTVSESYDIMLITDIFNRLYPAEESLPNYR